MSIREFVGVYREVNKPNQRIPVFKQGDSHIDLFDRDIDISKMVEVKPEVSKCSKCEKTYPLSELSTKYSSSYRLLCDSCEDMVSGT